MSYLYSFRKQFANFFEIFKILAKRPSYSTKDLHYTRSLVYLVLPVAFLSNMKGKNIETYNWKFSYL